MEEGRRGEKGKGGDQALHVYVILLLLVPSSPLASLSHSLLSSSLPPPSPTIISFPTPSPHLMSLPHPSLLPSSPPPFLPLPFHPPPLLLHHSILLPFSLFSFPEEVDNPFCTADMMDRLKKSDRTKAYMEDKVFLTKLEELREDPNKLIQ